jgi:predicted Zn-dependent peptidase
VGSCAIAAALDELYGLGYANSDSEDIHYQSVTAGQIRDVAGKYLNPDACVVAIVRPECAGSVPPSEETGNAASLVSAAK